MKNILTLALTALLLSACSGDSKFTVSGTIAEAGESQTIYLEQEGLDGIVAIDSAKLSSEGEYSLHGTPSTEPEFYRLRIAGEIVHLSVDSIADIVVDAKLRGMSSNYTVRGSKSSERIREIVLKQYGMEQQIRSIIADARSGKLDTTVGKDSLQATLDRYRDEMRLDYIYEDAGTAEAYYALFQRIDGMPLFNVYDDRDVKLFQAVATCWDTFHPEALRSKHLYNYVMKGLRDRKIIQTRRDWNIPDSIVKEVGIIDIELLDKNGSLRSLESVCKGNVVILDFCLQQHESSPAHNLALRKLYAQYRAQGLEIFQVSADKDTHYFRTVTAALPWVCVQETSTQTPAAARYNVSTLPVMFVIDSKGELQSRHDDINTLSRTLSTLF